MHCNIHCNVQCIYTITMYLCNNIVYIQGIMNTHIMMYIHAELFRIHAKITVAKGDGLALAKQKGLVQNKIKNYLSRSFSLPGVNHY